MINTLCIFGLILAVFFLQLQVRMLRFEVFGEEGKWIDTIRPKFLRKILKWIVRDMEV